MDEDAKGRSEAAQDGIPATERRDIPGATDASPGTADAPSVRLARLMEKLQDPRREYPVRRDARGRFVKGTPSPNPEGRGAGQELGELRRFGRNQTVKDLLELLEQPVAIRKGKVKKQVPAIIAIYDRLIHMAIGGDWNAMKKCVELREKYADFRENTLVSLMEEAQNCRQRFRDAGEEIPPHVLNLLRCVDEKVLVGQFTAG